MKLKLLTFLSLVFFSYSATAKDFQCPSSLSLEDIAKALIQVELSGIQIEDSESFECLAQSQHPHILIVSDVSNEVAPEIYGYVKDMSDVLIKSVEETDPEVHLHQVSFDVKVDRVQGLSTIVEEKIEFFLYKTTDTQNRLGCAAVTQHTEKVLLFKKCKK